MNQSASTLTGKTKIKIVLLGNQSVGKSCIIERYVKNIFDQTSNPTVGIDFLVKNVAYKSKNYRLQLWDTAGQQRFRALIPNYLKDAKCALIIIDVGNKSSLNNVEMWIDLFNQNKKGDDFTFVILVGNKIDLQYRQISKQQALKKAQQLKIPYFQVSAKSGANTEELFEKVIDVYQRKNVQSVTFTLQSNDVIQEQEAASEVESQVKNDHQPVEKELVKEAPKETKVILKKEKIDKKPKAKEKCC